MFHKPSDLARFRFTKAVDILTVLVCVTDAYGSLLILKMPVELAFRPFEMAILKAWDKDYPLLVHVTISIRSAWLLKQVVCNPIGNPAWPDERNSKEFEDPLAAGFVLAKREKLREMMQELDQKVLLLEKPGEKKFVNTKNPLTVALATAAFKAEMAQHIKDYNKKGWKFCPRKYWLFKNRQSIWRYDYWLKAFGNPSTIERHDFEMVINMFHSWACALVKPLLETVVPRDESISISDKKYFDQGLTCIDISDDELPWKDTYR